MNYQKLHDSIINHARQNPPQGTHEVHHIVPRCMGGTDEESNLIPISYRQHFILHWLWTKILPDHNGLNNAFHLMFFQNSSLSRPEGELVRRNQSRVYARNKAIMAQMTSARFKDVPKTEEQKNKMREAANKRWSNPIELTKQSERMKGNKNFANAPKRVWTEEQKRAKSISVKEWLKTNPHNMLGKHLSPESIEKMKASKAANPQVYTEERRANIAKVRLGKTHDQPTKDNISQKVARTWQIITPTGEVLVIVNLRKYCIENNLHTGNMSSVASGRLNHYKGYKVRKLDNQTSSKS